MDVLSDWDNVFCFITCRSTYFWQYITAHMSPSWLGTYADCMSAYCIGARALEGQSLMVIPPSGVSGWALFRLWRSKKIDFALGFFWYTFYDSSHNLLPLSTQTVQVMPHSLACLHAFTQGICRGQTSWGSSPALHPKLPTIHPRYQWEKH